MEEKKQYKTALPEKEPIPSAQAPEALLDIRGLRVEYHTDEDVVYAVNGLDLTIGKGESLGLVGETGAGKTTTALSVLRLIADPPGKIMGGEIWFEGEDMLQAKPARLREIRGSKISVIFQDPMTSLNPSMKVGDQIVEMIRLHKVIGKKEAFEEACGLLEMVGIRRERANDYPHQFSGGMKQRVVIAIALACRPKMIIADEPTTALDVTIQAQVLGMMEELKERFGTSMLLITHDLGVVAQTCDRVAIMYAGEIVEHGSIEDIFTGKEHHPYTQGLFGSIPSMTGDAKRLNPIAGLMPDPTNLPRGCKFHTRCPHCMEVCRQSLPQVYRHGTHEIACHLYVGDGEPGSKASYGKNGEPGSKAESAGIAESAGEEVGRV